MLVRVFARFWRLAVAVLLLIVLASALPPLLVSVLEPTADVGSMDLTYQRNGVAAGWKGGALGAETTDTHRPVPGLHGMAQEISTEGSQAKGAYIVLDPASLKTREASAYVLSFWYRRTGTSEEPSAGYLGYGPSRKWQFPLLPVERWTYVEVFLPVDQEPVGKIAFWASQGVTLQIDEVGLRAAVPSDQPSEGLRVSQPITAVRPPWPLVSTKNSRLIFREVQTGLFQRLYSGVEIGGMEQPAEAPGVAGGWSGWNSSGVPLEQSHTLVPGYADGTAQRITTKDNGINRAELRTRAGHLDQLDPTQDYTLHLVYRLLSQQDAQTGAYLALSDRNTGAYQHVVDLLPSTDWRAVAIPLSNPPEQAGLVFVVADPGVTLDLDEVSLVNREGVAGFTPTLKGSETAHAFQPGMRPPLSVLVPGGRIAFLNRRDGLGTVFKDLRWSLGGLAIGLAGFSLLSLSSINFLYGFMQGFVAWEPAPVDFLWVIWGLAGLITGALAWSRLRRYTGLHASVALFVVANLLSYSFAQIPNASLGYAVVTLYGIAICYSALLLFRNQDMIAQFRLGLIAAAVVNAVIALASAFGGESWAVLFSEEKRAFGFFKDPNVMGPFLVGGVLLLMDDVVKKSSRLTRLLQSLVQVLLVVGILLAQGRAALGALVISLLVFTAVRVRADRGQLVRGMFKVMIGVAIVALVAGVLYQRSLIRMDKIQVLMSYDVKDRFPVQLEALQMGLSRPLGIGPGASEETFDYATHSLYVRTLVENGWLGFASLMALIGYTIRELWRRVRTGGTGIGGPSLSVLFAWWLGILVNSLVIDTLHWRHFWVLLGLIWVQISRTDEQTERQDSKHVGWRSR